MTKQEAHNLTQSMIDYFTDILFFEHPDDIRFEIIDHSDQDKRSNIVVYPGYLVYDIRINITENEIPITEQICHELAHIFLSEYTQMFYQLFGEAPEDSIEFRTYDRANERTAMRIGRLLTEMWKMHQETQEESQEMDLELGVTND